jgi:hypothetical protein
LNPSSGFIGSHGITIAYINTLLLAIDTISPNSRLMSNMILSADRYLVPFRLSQHGDNVEKNQDILLVRDSAESTRYRAMDARHRDSQPPIPPNTIAKTNHIWHFQY